MSSSNILIAGAGHAGGRVAQSLRGAGYSGDITLVGEEVHAPYERPALSKELLTGAKQAAELTLGPAAFWEDPLSVTRIHARIDSIDMAAKVAHLSEGKHIAFNELVVATGGTPRALNVQGSDLRGVRMLRTLDDCHDLREVLQPGKQLVVIGGGVIGMEAAASAVGMGLQVTLLEAGPRVMMRCLPPQASEWLKEAHRSRGVAMHMQTAVTAIEERAGQLLVRATQGRDDVAFAADVVLVAIGLDPGTGFLVGSGIALDNGVLTDSFCRSPSASWCYAVGDIANTFSPLYQRYLRQETWRNAENQARAVAEIICGRKEPYTEVPWMWTDQFDRNIQVVGVYEPGDLVVSRGSFDDGASSMLWMHAGRVAGGVLLDNGRERKQLEALVRRGAQVDAAVLQDPQMSLKELAAA
jgi:3-phenylpropionate/trans-cinnamate dioxygenase ferredoxin reductase subunit